MTLTPAVSCRPRNSTRAAIDKVVSFRAELAVGELDDGVATERGYLVKETIALGDRPPPALSSDLSTSFRACIC